MLSWLDGHSFTHFFFIDFGYYEPYMKESEPNDCMYHTNKDVQPSAKIEMA